MAAPAIIPEKPNGKNPPAPCLRHEINCWIQLNHYSANPAGMSSSFNRQFSRSALKEPAMDNEADDKKIQSSEDWVESSRLFDSDREHHWKD